MYLTYAEYQTMGGALESSDFTSLEYKAEVKMDYYTFNRLKADTEFSDRVKRCIYEIINYLNIYQEYCDTVTNMQNPVVASQSNDGVSISYGGLLGNTTPNDIKKVEKQTEDDIYKTIRQYLDNERNRVGQLLLYRGVY